MSTPDSNGTSKEAESPQRRFTVAITAGGDTLNDLAYELRRFLGMIENGEKWCVTAGYTGCGEFRVTEWTDVTHESFTKSLDEYLERIP